MRMGLAVLIKAVRAGRVFINLSPLSLASGLRERDLAAMLVLPGRDAYTNSAAKNKKSPKWLGRLEMDA
jgi:hypothetical protein